MAALDSYLSEGDLGAGHWEKKIADTFVRLTRFAVPELAIADHNRG